MFLVKLGLKNLTRHKRRTLITAFSIAVGLVIFIIADSLMAGMEKIAYDNIINLETAHLAVMQDGNWDHKEKLSLDYLITQPEQLVDKLQKAPEVSGIAPRVKFGMLVNNGIDELPVMGIGIEPVQDAKIYSLKDYIVEGRMIEAGKTEVLIGQKLANLMGFVTGGYMTVVTKTKNGAYQAFEAEIVGLLKTADPAIDNETVYLPLDVVQQQLYIGNAVTELSVKLSDRRLLAQTLPQLTTALAETGQEIEVISWEILADSFIKFIQGQRGQNALIMLLIMVISIVGVINSIVLASLERTEEVGTLKALGLKEREIVSNFMVEGVGLGLLGGLIGCILAIFGVLYLTTVGVNITLTGIPIQDKVYGVWNIGTFVGAFLFGGIVAFIASIVPAFLAARKDPIEAIYGR